jgi:hypothetical protein
MQTVGLQLVTVVLENGQQGIFIGVPLIRDSSQEGENQVEEIWFSDIQQIPDKLSVAKLLRLVADQLARGQATIQ